MTTLRDALPYILPNCQNLPEEMGMDYARRAYVEFARRSGALVVTLNHDLQEGVVDYPLEPPEGCKIACVRRVIIEGCSYVAPSHDDIVVCHGWWQNGKQYLGAYGGSMNGTYGFGPNYWAPCGGNRFRMKGYECLLLGTAPRTDCEGGLSVEVSLQPIQDVCKFEPDFFERWVEGIAYGALMRALMLPNTDWFDPNLSKEYRRLFNVEIQRAKQAVDLNFSRGPMTMRARRFV